MNLIYSVFVPRAKNVLFQCLKAKIYGTKKHKTLHFLFYFIYWVFSSVGEPEPEAETFYREPESEPEPVKKYKEPEPLKLI